MYSMTAGAMAGTMMSRFRLTKNPAGETEETDHEESSAVERFFHGMGRSLSGSRRSLKGLKHSENPRTDTMM